MWFLNRHAWHTHLKGSGMAVPMGMIAAKTHRDRLTIVRQTWSVTARELKTR